MSTKVYGAIEVGAKIVEWHSCIIAHSFDQAILLKDECQHLVRRMEPMIKPTFLWLISVTSCCFKEGSMGQKRLNRFQQTNDRIEPLLNYLYYFVSGQNEFRNERYRAAIRLFNKAERLLEYVKDDSEEAEFHYYAGYTYYHLNQYPIACSYIENARLIFDRLGYSDKSTSCDVILGGIYSETNYEQKAVELFDKALSHCETEAAKGIVLQAMALNGVRYGNYSKAIDLIEKALELNEHRDNYHGMRSLSILANAYFRNDDFKAGELKLQQAESEASFYNSEEYQARCLANRGLYVNDDLTYVDQAISMLQKRSLDFEVAEVAKEAADVLRKKGEWEKALNYLTIAFDARLNQNSMGVEQS
ncbi:LOW QUALITY PROTEIN: response regulator aspartate phosphatase [Bacillus sp. JCM 19046]|nr:LOW QUALITY PROTEIN: response regulator aspartate phosphatase [Bacillus sp. JCM 19046]